MFRSGGKSLRTFGWLVCLAGCAGTSFPWRPPALPADSSKYPINASTAAATNSSDLASGRSAAPNAGGGVTPTSYPRTDGFRSPAASNDPQDLTTVLAELERLGAIDEATRQRLIDDLKKTDPVLWPQLLSYFKASLAYRQKYIGEEETTTQVAAQPMPEPRPAARPTAAAGGADRPGLLPDDAQGKLSPMPPPQSIAATAPGARTAMPDTAATAAITDEAVQPAAYQTAAAATPGAQPAASPDPAAENSVPVATAGSPAAAPGAALTATAAASLATPEAGATTTAAGTSAATSAAAPGAVAAAALTAGTKPGSPAPPAEIDPLDWRGHLRAAISGLERETADPPATTAAIGRYAGLRLLYLVDGNRDGALRPVAGIPPTQQDFWSEQLFGLSTYLDAEKTPDDARRAAAAVLHLREAHTKLGDLATLMVRNVAFATEVQSYGVYKKFEKYEFHPGQEVLLYAEVENFKSASSEQGFHTALRSSYQILDNRGARVDQKEFEVTEEHCQNPRRDYFLRYFVWMPKRIYGGTYTLQLTIEDTLSQKIGQASIEFTVADKE